MKRVLQRKRKKQKRREELSHSGQVVVKQPQPKLLSDNLPAHHTTRPLQQKHMLQLQTQQGNKYVQGKLRQDQETAVTQSTNNQATNTLQRALSEGDKLENLSSARFAGDARLESANDNAPPMKKGDPNHDAVAKVQQAFIDLGFPMPVSTKKSGGPDGIFGSETWNVVWKFQGKYNLSKDGVIGRETMGKLDILFSKENPMPGSIVITDKMLQEILDKFAQLPKSSAELIKQLEIIAQQLAIDPAVNIHFLSLFEKMRLQAAEKEASPQLIEAIDTCIRQLTVHIGISESKEALKNATTTLTDEERKAAEKAMKPPVKGGGKQPDFKSVLASGEIYKERMHKYLETTMEKAHKKLAEGKGPAERTSANLHPWQRLEEIGNAAKVAVDTVFGNYAKAPPLKANVNLFDQWEQEEKQNKKLSAAQKTKKADNLLKYFVNAGGKKLRKINDEHGADINRQTISPGESKSEFEILKEIRAEMLQVAGTETKLLEIDRGWPATQGGGAINLQRWKQDTDDDTRKFFWDMFQVMIHEYLHMLTHPKYEVYADKYGYGSSQYNTLIEGMDSVFTETVWENTESKVSSAALRLKVEGAEFAGQPFDDKLIPDISDRRYPSYNEAMNLASTVGMKNALAAYFLGVMKGWPVPKKP